MAKKDDDKATGFTDEQRAEIQQIVDGALAQQKQAFDDWAKTQTMMTPEAIEERFKQHTAELDQRATVLANEMASQARVPPAAPPATGPDGSVENRLSTLDARVAAVEKITKHMG